MNEELKDQIDELMNVCHSLQELNETLLAENRKLSNKVESICKKQETTYYYNLVSATGEKLFPCCIEDNYGYFSRYAYESRYELYPGDYIRMTDDFYNIGMVKVIKRISSSYYDGQITLVCENVDPKDDYVFTVDYAKDVLSYVNSHKDSIEIDSEAGIIMDSDFISHLIETLVRGKTTVDHVIVIRRTHQILDTLLKGWDSNTKTDE